MVEWIKNINNKNINKEFCLYAGVYIYVCAFICAN